MGLLWAVGAIHRGVPGDPEYVETIYRDLEDVPDLAGVSATASLKTSLVNPLRHLQLENLRQQLWRVLQELSTGPWEGYQRDVAWSDPRLRAHDDQVAARGVIHLALESGLSRLIRSRMALEEADLVPSYYARNLGLAAFVLPQRLDLDLDVVYRALASYGFYDAVDLEYIRAYLEETRWPAEAHAPARVRLLAGAVLLAVHAEGRG